MEMLGTLCFSLILASLAQITPTQAQDCKIKPITSPSASSLLVQWSKYDTATYYFLDVRVKNETDIAPVVVTITSDNTMKSVHGLRPATTYMVTLKVFEFYSVRCVDRQETTTVPGNSQITYWEAISSTAIRLEWSQVRGADGYFLVIENRETGERRNMSLATLSAEIHNLRPSTAYDCSIYSSNVAGMGVCSKFKTVITLVQPPEGITATQTGNNTARVNWAPVNKVLMYQVTITQIGQPVKKTIVTNSTTTFLDIFNIQPCSTYNITVASVNDFLQPGDTNYVIYTTNTISPVISLSVDYSCSSGSVTVTWGAVFGADLYRAIAVDSNGTDLFCTSASTDCQITGVRCGKSYRVHVISISNNCESTADATTYFDTVPCAPSDLAIYRECSSNVIIFSWEPKNHTTYYVATGVDSTGVSTQCLTTDTACLFDQTSCGRGYDFTVYAVSGTCSSDISGPASIRTAPCAATNLKTNAECNSEVVLSTWDMAPGALSYTVEALGNVGHHSRYNCSSVTNSCAIPGVHCGESLTIRMISSDNECSSETVLGVADTVPCIPQNVSAITNGSSDSITVRWMISHGAFFYLASAVHPDGTVHTCPATDTQCRIQGLRCGQTYTAFVKATNLKCNSSESEHISVETAPCPPDHIEASLDCAANHALIAWRSDLTGASYTATIEDGEGGLLSCMTTGSHCTIPDLECGLQYAVSVTLHTSISPSMPSDTIHMDSVPCGPVNMQTALDCGTGVLDVSWNASVQAEGYTTTVTSESGHVRVHQNSTAPRCSFGTLECGWSYMVMVQAVYRTCLSMPSSERIREVPCVPTNVMVECKCNTSSVGVTWEPSRGARYYKAVAVGNSGHTAHCSSNETACSLADLRCGQVYTVGVRAMDDDDCNSLQSQTVTLRTVPCPPSHLGGGIDCVSNTASLSWDASPNAVSYLGTAVGMDGHTASCDSQSPGCQMTGLGCGQEYVFTVSATDGKCQSPESAEFSLVTAPCALQNVGTHLDCTSDVLTVIWDASAAALNYSATVRMSSGIAYSCGSAGSSCDINSLGCGQQYSTTVTAANEYCNGPASTAHTIQTVPCIPQGVTGQVDYGTNGLTASWRPSPGASSYTATLSGPGGYSESCSTPGLTCSFSGLLCARQYAVSVVAHGERCDSAASPAVSTATEPCDAEGVVTVLHDNNMLTVSWNASAGASIYTVQVQNKDGADLLSCHTESTSCLFGPLDCGSVYDITLLTGNGTRPLNPQAVVATAPCDPESVVTVLHCQSNTLTVSWNASAGASIYTVLAQNKDGHLSCQTGDTSCQVGPLDCGNVYNIFLQTGDGTRNSPSEPQAVIETAPCAPSMVNSQYDCGTSIAMVSWDDSLGRESFRACVEGDGHTDCCSTADTMCHFTSLQCGQSYNVTVTAVAGRCNSSQAIGSSIQTGPCSPQNVSTYLMCANNTAVVTWASSAGAVDYIVTALGRDGDIKSCRTTNTSCELPMMHCGEVYTINVTPYSETCRGFDSETINYAAGPCPLNSLTVALQCDGNVGTVSWQAVTGAELYVATARADDEHEHTCNSSSTSCSFTDLHCATTYSITVVIFMMGCYSDPSPGENLKTAICPPINLEGHMSCGTNILMVMWDPSPVLGVTYFLVSEKEGGARTTLTTTDTSHAITSMQCGEHYSIGVIVQDSTCNSSLSLPLEMDTAPCLPSNLETMVDCGTSNGTISWVPALGAVSYVVEAVGAHGHKASCSTNGISCSVKLHCSRHYTATVIATNDNCNSSLDAFIEFDSAPCLPGDVFARLNCSTNQFSVQWDGNVGTDTYTALAIGSDGDRASCTTLSTACTIKSLHCGQTYSIAVDTSSVQCGQIQGSDYTVQSAPCTAMNPAVNVDCGTHDATATVSWDSSSTAQQINVVTAVDHLGHAFSCSTTNSSCTFDSLSCGEAYSFSIVGETDQCRTPTTSTMGHTAPCVPSHVEASYDCDTGIAMVMWDSARGATSYSVEAIGSLGHNSSCLTTDTQCSMDQLRCGQNYNVTVTAHRDGCRGPASETVVVTTGPCPHSDLAASRDCASNTVVVSWSPGQGALLYNASVESLASGHRVSCSTDGSACNVSSLQCAERYQVSVEGRGLSCDSRPGSWVSVNAAPCPPTQVNVQSFCDSNVASVSWAPAKGAVMYVAAAVDGTGNMVTCNTSDTACSITGLSCGQTYDVSVTALDEECVGGRSETHTMKTAPCVPTAVETNLQCLTGLLSVVWQRSNGALFYHAVVQRRTGGTVAHVKINSTDFSTNLLCGHAYDVTVYASDEVCNSSRSPAKTITAAPCPPVNIVTDVDCSTSITTVFWNSSAPGVIYTALAIGAGGKNSSCNTTDSYCTLPCLRCGTEYNVTVSGCLGGCVGAQTSKYTFRTAPCVPVLTEVEIDCLSDSAWVVWEQSVGAELYTASATDDQGQVFQCNTSESTCAVPDLQCGRHYTFTVAASDQQCTSLPSNAIMSDSVPCPPQHVVASVGCRNRTASIAWAESYLALMYTATLERTDGETSCCSTAGTSCSIPDLPCGQMYVVTVSAEGLTCNSSQSVGQIIRTEPCIPQNLSACVSCGSNVAKATWTSSHRGQMYIVQANGIDGHSVACNSFDNNCDLGGLRCGQSYTVTVVAEDSTCTSAESLPAQFKTVPCVPKNVSTDMDCGSNSMSISWAESAGADSYTATVTDREGRSTNCKAVGATSCDVSGLNCGETYYVIVAASDGYCTSPAEGPAIRAQTVPCPVSRIQASMDCMSLTAFVSWNFSAGALSYDATMETGSGDVVACSTNLTNCAISELACGESYSVSVLARGETCSRMAQMAGSLQTEPCMPLNLEVQYSLSIGQLIWDMSKGATYYSAEAITRRGLRASCNTTDSNCAIYEMACGQTYNITVTAHNQACKDIATSDPIIVVTEPCAPRHVEADLNCETNTASVSWEMSEYAVGYQAFLDGRDGDSASCHTNNNTSCSVDGMHCGTAYYVRVQALGKVFNSSDSSGFVLVTAPCAPDSVEVEVDCKNGSALVTWGFSHGAVSYVVSAVGINGHMASCSTEMNSCKVTELSCGETYNLTLTSINEQCDVVTDTGLTVQTRPCAPLRVGVDLQCGNNAAMLSWGTREGVEHYVANATKSSGEDAGSCDTTGSTCLFSSLDCGETYSFTVTAYSSQCESQRSDTVEISTEPCRPGRMSAVVSCGNDMVLLGWAASRGASDYIVTATGDLGYSIGFNTTDTSLEVWLPCGQTFSFSVVALGEQCDSPRSDQAEFRTAPCVPQDVQAYVQCEGSVGSVSWMASDGAESYTAVAVGQDNHTHMCITNTTSCNWTDLHCGDVYSVHVIASDDLCDSLPSNGTVIHMAPCVPQNLVSTLDCDRRAVTLTWEASEGALWYIVTAEVSNTMVIMEVPTQTNSIVFSEFTCGQVYYLSVKAQNKACISVPSAVSSLRTEPCAPTDVTSQLDCLTNIVLVAWAEAEGAEYYTATVRAEDGETSICMSTSTQCGIPGLQCARNYTVSVTASSAECWSDPSNSSCLHSAPCIPENVAVDLDCTDNTALVSWNHSRGALSYRVVAQSLEGNDTCESSVPHCHLTNLVCGATYTVWVVALDSSCTTFPSERVQVQSVPCTTEILSAHLDCVTDSVLMGWAHADGASFYIGVAETSGDTSVCNSSQTNCNIVDLECGQIYSVRITASNGICNSSASAPWQIASAPCPPQNVAYHLDCASHSAHVTWQAADGAESYKVHAIGWGGLAACDTTELACVVPDLMCGSDYNISVVAIRQHCNVSESEVMEMEAVPCVPQAVEASVDCETGVLSVSWEPSIGAISYDVVAEGDWGYPSFCNTSGTECQFADLLCGTPYNVTVIAIDDVCTSEQSTAVEVDTVPCEPQNVSAAMECASNTGLVSWEQNEGVASYHVEAAGEDSHMTQCSSTSTSCRLPGLHCGQRYSLTVTEEHEHCTSRANLSLQSVPCAPHNVQAGLQCASNSIAIAWERSSGALSYRATGNTADGYTATCDGSAPHCDLEALHCGQTYDVSVLAIDESCTSAESESTPVRTAPCPPSNLEVSNYCDAGILMVRWDANTDADSFRVEAVTSDGTTLSCRTQDTNCAITDMQCGHVYAVHAVSIRDGCESAHTRAVSVLSAPCVPQELSGAPDCVMNSAWMTWEAAMGAHTYTVTAEGVGGYNASCSTTDTTCNVPDLRCGVPYTIHLTASNDHCQSPPSATLQMETAPCTLNTIDAINECHSSTIQVRWQTTGSHLYAATAEGNERESFLSCASATGSCDLIGARCDVEYTISVAPSSDKCSGLRSPPHKIRTAPCAPQNVSFQSDCESSGVVVSWAPSFVAESYLLTARGRDGFLHACDTTVSNCTLLGLQCGQPYSFNVTVISQTCSSSNRDALTFSTVPCDPDNLAVELQCASNSAVLSWSAGQGSLEYFAFAHGNNGDTLFCGGTDSSCIMEGLECGAVYDFSVLASDGICNSSLSAPLHEGAVPCPPEYVKTRILPGSDEDGVLRVSWSRVSCPVVEYLVDVTGYWFPGQAFSQFLKVASYWTECTFFEFPLPCSSTYIVTVKSGNSAGISQPSVATSGYTVPCPPQNVTYSGNSTLAKLSWQASIFATEYAVYKPKGFGTTYELVCNTTQLFCILTEVHSLEFKITASNSAGESSPNILQLGPISTHTNHSLAGLIANAGLIADDLVAPQIVVFDVKRVSLVVQWGAVKGATFYTIRVIKFSTGEPMYYIDSPLVPIGQLFYTVTRLEPNMEYCINVKAENVAATSLYSNIICVVTAP